MALLQCIENPITLEIYVDADGQATGSMYVDDGLTTEYQTAPETASALIDFTYSNNSLKSTNSAQTKYVFGKDQHLTLVTIYGLGKEPSSVVNESDGGYLDFNYSKDEDTLNIDARKL